MPSLARVVVEAPRIDGVRRTYRYAGGEARRVADAMTWPAVVVHTSAPAAFAAELALAQRVHHLPVVDDDYLVGCLCLCDLRDADPSTPVRRWMSRSVATVVVTALLEQAATQMRARDVGCLPVVASGRVCGVVTRGDLVRAGALEPAERRICMACGTHHHVRSHLGGTAFCSDCLDRGRPVDDLDPYLELGTGD